MSCLMSVCHVENMQISIVMIASLHIVKFVISSGTSILREVNIKQSYVILLYVHGNISHVHNISYSYYTLEK